MTPPSQEEAGNQARELLLLRALFRGDATTAVEQFAGEPVIDAPRVGRVVGAAAVERLACGWPGLFRSDSPLEIELRCQTAACGRSISEVVVPLDLPHATIRLLVGVMGTFSDDGSLSEARIYYFEQPLTGEPGFRPPAVKRGGMARLAQEEDVPQINAEYFNALTAGDIERTMAVFGENAYMESGLSHLSTRAEIRTVYEHFCNERVRLYADSVTDDGTRLVLEWHSPEEPVRGGLAVYERDASNKIGAIRLYDNFDPDAL